jgi:heme oxygenase (biliverdin-IX-beta and delta-forming)
MILQQLRSGTAHLHERVERAVNLSSSIRSLEAYTALLGRYYGFYKPLEDRLVSITGFADVGLELKPRLKTPLLRDDLSALGYSEIAIDSLPICVSLPALDSLSRTLGCLYVLEGATLGGKIVRREVERVHGLVAGLGCSFFSSYGDDVGLMWKSFCIALEGFAQRTRDAHDIVGAAVATFTAFEHWLLSDGHR